ncbi:putative quinol monooxygenase [Mycolicibacterium hodleri]|nr:putative quinol monooxygenase [Mycolicibacterium hodleri]
MPKPIVIVAHWQTTTKDLDTVLGLVAELAPRSIAEPGCLGYEVLQAVDDEPNRLVLIERYADRAALDAHLGSTHYQELVAGRIRPLLTGRQVTVLGAVDLPAP